MKLKLSAILILTILLALLGYPASITPQVPEVALAADWGKMPLHFIANQGQMDAQVAYYVQGSDKTLYFTSDGVTFSLTDLTPLSLTLYRPGTWVTGVRGDG